MTGHHGLCIRLLGEVEVLRDGAGAAPLPASRKTRALLGYLAATDRPHRREHLCDLLWDGPDDPRAELRWSLSKIRQVLHGAGGGYLQADREHVAFQPEAAEVDLLKLRQLLSPGVSATSTAALREAVGLFRGEFLDGLDLPSCYRFHEWCLAEREAASALRLAALGGLVERLQEEAPEEALAHARALVVADPLAEAGHAAIVRLLIRLGRRRGALEHHGRARRMLENELAAPPSGELERAQRGLQLSTRIPTPPWLPAADIRGGYVPFVGRRNERILIGEQVSAAAMGQAWRVPFVTGEPGIGKSRLLANLVEQAVQAGGRTLGARAFEAEGAVRVYGVWIDALRSISSDEVPPDLQADLAALKPELGPVPSSSMDRTRLFEAVTELLRHLSERRPVIVLVDDIQWLDEASAALLHYAFRRAGDASPLLFAFAARSGELEDNAAAAQIVRTLGREGRLLLLPLGPLTPREATELVHAVDPTLDALSIAAASEGSPLLALELARAGQHGGGGEAAAPKLDALVASQLARLTQRAREALIWAAALGRGFDPELLGRVSGLGMPELTSALEEWERRGIVRPATGDAGDYDFAHDLVRQAVYRMASQPRRRLVHRHITRILEADAEADDAVAANLARHAELCGDHALAVRACRAAGDRCLRLFAAAEATAFAGRGLLHLNRLLPAAQDPAARIELLRLSVRAAQGPDLRRLPAEVAVEVAHATVAAERAGLAAAAAMGHHLLSVLHVDAGDTERARDSALRAAEAGRIVADTAARARRLANTARCLVDLGTGIDHAGALLQEAEVIVGALGIELCELHWGRGLLERWNGVLANALPRLERALALAQSEQDRWREYQCLTWLATTLLEQGQHAEARLRCTELAEVAARLGSEEGPFADVLDALAEHGAAGKPQGRMDKLKEALGRLRDTDHKAHLSYALNATGEVYRLAGQTVAARSCAEEALAAATAVRREGEAAVARAFLVRIACAGSKRPAAGEIEWLLAEAANPGRLGARADTAIFVAVSQVRQDTPTMASTISAPYSASQASRS